MKAHDKIEELRRQGFIVRVRHERPVESSDERVDGLWITKGDLRDYHAVGMAQFIDDDYDLGASFSDTRGRTVVGIGIRITNMLNPEESYDEILATGESGCYHRDRWNRKMGLQVALGRAVKMLEAIIAYGSPRDASATAAAERQDTREEVN